jgi:hypothetical protein
MTMACSRFHNRVGDSRSGGWSQQAATMIRNGALIEKGLNGQSTVRLYAVLPLSGSAPAERGEIIARGPCFAFGRVGS